MKRPKRVPATSRCHTSRLQNVPTERLLRRFAVIYPGRSKFAREVDGRRKLRAYAGELLGIEAELDERVGARFGPEVYVTAGLMVEDDATLDVHVALGRSIRQHRE